MSKTFEQARAIILERVEPLEIERVVLAAAIGRILAAEIKAPWGMPLWDNSAMDGFAVGSEACEQEGEVRLVISAYIPAGQSAEGIELAPGCAVKVMTGAPVPVGSAAVVPVEHTEEVGDVVVIKDRIKTGNHIRYRQEDIAEGEIVLRPGTLLRPPESSLLASFGLLSVPVYRRPAVAILSTGDELVAPGEPPGPGQIVDSNSHSLAAAVIEMGAEPVMLGIARDDRDDLREKLTRGLQADVLVSSAGISVGDRDFVQEILLELGVETIFTKVRVKPGRPTTFGVCNGKPVFALPGNPVSGLLTFEQFVRPALLRMMGHREVIKPLVKAQLTHTIRKKSGSVQLYRVRLYRQGDGWMAASAGDQNTGILKTLVNANGIAILPSDKEIFTAGEEIEVHLLPGSFQQGPG